MHVLEWHHSETYVGYYEGETLPPFVYITEVAQTSWARQPLVILAGFKAGW